MKYCNKGYLLGSFFSKKNNQEMTYRSSYELKFFFLLEQDPSVLSYLSEPIEIPYREFRKGWRNYIPDVIVLRDTGVMEVCEIKPEAMLDDQLVKIKAKACKCFFYKVAQERGIDCEYKFITESSLFKNRAEYLTFVREHEHSKRHTA